jgi:hypothetical protein
VSFRGILATSATAAAISIGSPSRTAIDRDGFVAGAQQCRLSRAQQENALDEALKDTFPASDPISAEQPVSPATGCGVARREGGRCGGRSARSARANGVLSELREK